MYVCELDKKRCLFILDYWNFTNTHVLYLSIVFSHIPSDKLVGESHDAEPKAQVVSQFLVRVYTSCQVRSLRVLGCCQSEKTSWGAMPISHRPTPHHQSFQYPSSVSSRSSYPSFLSIQDSLRLQLNWAWRGLYDAFRWNIVISTISGWFELY